MDPTTLPAPADTPPQPAPPPPTARRALLAEIGWHAAFAAVTVGVLVAGLRLERADLGAPFEYDGDALLILPFVKATVERGSHWRNERLGAPGVQELHDFPVVDHLHFALIWALGQVVRDPFAVYNLYYLLTYPLTTLAGMFVLRRLGLSVPASGCGGLLYAFQPYHYLRGQMHYFLAAYFIIPLTLLVALRVCQGRLPFFAAGPDGRYRLHPWTADTLTAVLIGVATASAGAYYAFFACALLVVAGLYGWAALRTWRAAASAGLVVLVVVAAGVANHAPAFAYQARYGRNSAPTERLPEEAEIYGLKLAQLVLPVEKHHLPALDAVNSTYDTNMRPLQNENKSSNLGLVGSVGLAVLLAVAVLPVRKRWPLGPAAVLALAAVLIGTIGGAGSVFNHLISPQVRCYNRISIYIAFLAVFAACRLLDRALAGRPGWARWAAFAGLATFGLWDQTNSNWFEPGQADRRAGVAEEFRADARFFAEVEDRLPGGVVFNLPYNPYPETPSFAGGMSAYYGARGYLHTRSLRWSYGSMKGREVDLWQREVSLEPPDRMLPRLVARGFDGLLVDRRGYKDPDGFTAALLKELGPDVPRVAHPGGNEVFYDLRPYRDRLRATDPGKLEELRRRDEERVWVLWLHGFFCFEPVGEEDRHRWCTTRGEAVFVNPSDRTRAFRLEAVIRPDAPDPADLRIDGGEVWTERRPISAEDPKTERIVIVPPGRHTVRFRCRMPDSYKPHESRRLAFFIAQLRMTEVPVESVKRP